MLRAFSISGSPLGPDYVRSSVRPRVDPPLRHARFGLLPSILSADPTDLASALRAAEDGGADAIHVDVMDGHFVPNISFGPAVVKAVRARTRLPLDVHLMISEPGRYLDAFARAGGDTLCFHFEAGGDPVALAQEVRALGRRPGLAVRPDTPFEKVEPILGEFDEVTVMTVMPGFSGQRFRSDVLPKMRKVREVLDRSGRGADLCVDGGVTVETIGDALRGGANLFVCGNSVYADGTSPQASLRTLRERLAQEAGVEVL